MIYTRIVLPQNAMVFVLEDSPMRVAWFKKHIPPEQLVIVDSVKKMKDYFSTNPICDFIFLDHDLGEGSGDGVEAAVYLRERFGGLRNASVIHSWNRDGARRMADILPNSLIIPFGEFDVCFE